MLQPSCGGSRTVAQTAEDVKGHLSRPVAGSLRSNANDIPNAS
jgi:hypothetical protein